MNFLQTLLQHPLVLLFIVANLAIGFWAHRRSRAGSFEDYALASRSLPTGVLVMTLLGTLIGGGSLLDSSWAYRYGALQGLGTIFYCILLFLIGRFIAPSLVYFDGAITMGDLMKRLYGVTAQRLTGFIGILVSLLVVSSQMQTIGKMSEVVVGMDPFWTTVMFGIVITMYSAWGGMRIISYTDVLQLMLTMLALYFVCQTLVQKVGGMKVLAKGIPSEKLLLFHHPRFLKKVKMVSFWVLFPTFLLTPPIFQRLLLASHGQKSRNAWYISALIYGLVSCAILFIGMGASAGRVSLGLEDTYVDLLPRVIKSLFTSTMAIDFIFIGIISALVSTIDSFLHAISVSITHDLMNVPFDRAGSTKRDTLVMTKLMTMMMGFLTIVLSLSNKTKHLTNLTFYTYAVLLYAIVLVPLLIGIMGVKTDRASLGSFCATYVMGLFAFHYAGWDKHVYFFLVMMLSTLVYFLTHLYVNGGIVTVQRGRQGVGEKR